MNLLKKKIGTTLVLVAGLLAGGAASASPITMNFDGLTLGASVNRHYDGGCARLRGVKVNCHGPHDGVVWKKASIGNRADAPSGSGFAGLALGPKATMNVAAGFDTGMTFYYYAGLGNLSYGFDTGISAYSGLNGRGRLLSYLDLGQTDGSWQFSGFNFSGTARSVIFTGDPVFLTGFDSVTLGVPAPATPVPEPSAFGVFGFGLLLMGLFAGFRRRCD